MRSSDNFVWRQGGVQFSNFTCLNSHLAILVHETDVIFFLFLSLSFIAHEVLSIKMIINYLACYKNAAID